MKGFIRITHHTDMSRNETSIVNIKEIRLVMSNSAVGAEFKSSVIFRNMDAYKDDCAELYTVESLEEIIDLIEAAQ